MDRIKFLWKYAAKYKPKLILALVFLTFVSGANLVYPWLFKFMVDRFTEKSFAAISFTGITLILISVFIFSAVLGHYTAVLMQELGSRLRNDIRVSYYSKILSMPFAFFKQENTGEITSRASEDIGKLQPVFSTLVVTIYQNSLFIAGCVILMFILNWFAAIVVIILIIIPLPVILYHSKKIRSLSAESQHLHARANAVMEEALVGIREVKSFLLEKLKIKKYSLIEDSALQKETALAGYQSKSTQSVYLLLSITLIAIFYFSQSGGIFSTAGDAVAFFFYAYALTMAFLSIGRAYGFYQNISGSTSRIAEILETPEERTGKKDLLSDRIKGKVEFREVSFSYEKERPVLEKLSFTVDEGKWFLVTGPSGSGKSTIAALIQGFYAPGSGEILIDGIKLNDYDPESFKSQTGYVGEEPVLFEGTLEENILLTRTDCDSLRINNILKTCMIDKFVSSLPGGLGTVIGERGVTLSAGQKARIAIARALVSDPAILILDEANSNLEDNLERILWQNLLKEREGKTTIIFSHHITNIPQIYLHKELG